MPIIPEILALRSLQEYPGLSPEQRLTCKEIANLRERELGYDLYQIWDQYYSRQSLTSSQFVQEVIRKGYGPSQEAPTVKAELTLKEVADFMKRRFGDSLGAMFVQLMETFDGVAATETTTIMDSIKETCGIPNDSTAPNTTISPVSPHLRRPVFDIFEDEPDYYTRLTNIFYDNGIERIGDLVTKTEGELMAMKGFGKKSLRSVMVGLSRFNLHLGMEIKGWPPEEPPMPESENEALVRQHSRTVVLGTLPMLSLELKEFCFPIRALNAFELEGLVYIGELVQKSEAELLRMGNLGRVTLEDVKSVLADLGLRLGMEIHGWPPELC